MTDIQHPDSSQGGDRPGKTRTMWHPLLVRMLDYTLGSAYTVREEVSVGKMPLRVDIVLIRREIGHLSEVHSTEISALLPLLNRFTLVEFKGPTDLIERGDFAQLAGCSFLWHSQESEPIPHDEVSLIVLAPTVSSAFREELRLLGLEASRHEPGIFRVAGLPFAAWLVETDVMAERGQAVLSLVSRVFLNDRRGIIERLGRDGHGRLVSYASQQIHQFRKSKDFAVHYADTEKLVELDEDVLAEILQWLPAEERVRGLPPEERLRGLSPEERLAGLSDEDVKRLRELLERRQAR